MNTDISKNNGTPEVPCFKFESTPTADRLRELRFLFRLILSGKLAAGTRRHMSLT